MAELKFHFIKSPTYQDVPYDGAFGGVLPRGDGIFMAMYSERPAIPTVTIHELTEDGNLGSEFLDRRETRDGFIRTVHAGFHLSRDDVVSLRDWLNRKLEQLDKVNADGDES